MAKIKKGSFVFWNDPGIDDFEPKDRQPQLDRVFRVISINEDEAWIREIGGKVGSETQVPPWELSLVQNKSPKKAKGAFVVLGWSDNILDYDPEVLYSFGSREEAWNFAVKEAESEAASCDNEFPLKKDKKNGRITMDVLGEKQVWQVKELIKKE
jgi:hypothetical protein